MAKSDAVWGIDIGQCSLKALRCRAGDTSKSMVVEAFDYIAYPKILSQPGADPVELIQEALKQFLSRNTVKGDRVAISVPGQNGLARFIKLPPVEAKKIPDIVKYEAKQQIPFDLADVVWDYQRMGGGSEAEGFILETEVGLFAMKRDQVFRSLEPFRQAGIEVDYVQLTPLALYNYLLFDQLDNLPPVEEYMPDDPPPSSVILSLGTDATDLVITNGFRVWQRSIPLGGNHFTKALTKDLKLTFAKAEHLKCNAAKSKDPKRLFQAMRPVFNDLLTEIQRSIGYYSSIDRHAKLEKMVGLGNAMKMPGLRRYLEQSLDMEVIRVDQFNHLMGEEVLTNSTFRRNAPSFGVCYGLAVQALGVGQGTLKTNLLPREIIKERFIREKKPWTAACLAMVLLGCTIGYASQASALKTVAEDRFKNAENQANQVATESQTLKSDEEQAITQFDATDQIGQHLLGNVDNRVLWLEMLRGVNECLPYDEGERPPIEKYYERNELMIESVECQKVTDLGQWFQAVKQWYQPSEDALAAVKATGDPSLAGDPSMVGGTDPMAAGGGNPMGGGGMDPMMGGGGMSPMGSGGMDPMMGGGMSPMGSGGMDPMMGGGMSPMGSGGMDPMMGGGGETPGSLGDGVNGPTGAGWLIQLRGHHYHNSPVSGPVSDAQYVRETLLRNLQDHELYLPVVKKGLKDKEGKEITEKLVSLKDLGIGYPVLLDPGGIYDDEVIDPASLDDQSAMTGEGMGGMPGAMAGGMPGPRAGRMPAGGVMGGVGTADKNTVKLRRFDFTVQFVWIPTPPSERLEKEQKPANAEGADAADLGDEAATTPEM